MKKNNQHILQQVNLEINTTDEKTAFEIKSRIDSFLKDDLFPKVERLFDEMASPEEIQRFESIQMEFELKHAEDIDLLTEKFVSQIREKLETADSEADDFNRDWDKAGNKSFLAENQEPEKPDGPAFTAPAKRVSIDAESNLKNTFIYFLETGQLPWYAIAGLLNEFMLPILFNQAINDKKFIGQLKELFLSNGGAVKRFLYQFSNDTIELVIKQLRQTASIRQSDWNNLVLPENQALRILFYELIINKLIDPNYQITPEMWQDLHSEIWKTLGEMNETQQINNQAIEILLQIGFDRKDFGEETNAEQEPLLSRDENSLQEPDETMKTVFIGNAGLILAHPFLKELFRRANCLDKNGQFLSSKQFYAIHLLHFLGTGEEQAMEHELTFEKFLCAVPLGMPIERKVDLLDQDKIQCNDLLKAMISNWSALKNTSPEGLRQTFILREGKLDLQKSPTKLYVGRKAFDVLLDKLPWSISVVKLPWMNDLLFVDW